MAPHAPTILAVSPVILGCVDYLGVVYRTQLHGLLKPSAQRPRPVGEPSPGAAFSSPGRWSRTAGGTPGQCRRINDPLPTRRVREPAAISAIRPPPMRPSITPGGVYPLSFSATKAEATSPKNARRQPITAYSQPRADTPSVSSPVRRTRHIPRTTMACQHMIAQTPQTTAGTASGWTSGKVETARSTAAGTTHTCNRTDSGRNRRSPRSTANEVLRLIIGTSHYSAAGRESQWRFHMG